jgi:hypothetical protein
MKTRADETWGGLLFLVADNHVEHDRLGGERRHLVAEAVLVEASCVRGKCVLAVGLALTRIHNFALGVDNLQEVRYDARVAKVHMMVHG